VALLNAYAVLLNTERSEGNGAAEPSAIVASPAPPAEPIAVEPPAPVVVAEAQAAPDEQPPAVSTPSTKREHTRKPAVAETTPVFEAAPELEPVPPTNGHAPAPMAETATPPVPEPEAVPPVVPPGRKKKAEPEAQQLSFF
jgi:hypothetical protein